MGLGFVFQCVFAVVLWLYALHSVYNLYERAYWGGADFARALRGVKRVSPLEVSVLVTVVRSSALGEAILEHPGDPLGVDVATRAELSALTAIDRSLRGLATVSTTVGLLLATAMLRTVLGGTTGVSPSVGAGRAMDSAVLGLLTAMPCWTAVALCRKRLRAARGELDLAVGALAETPDETPGGLFREPFGG